MAVLLLIRHGQNDMVGKKLAGRLPNVHLNAVGEAQARRLAAELAARPVRAVYASPLARAQETAQPIARVHDLPVETWPGLLEIDFGTWQGKRIKRLKKRKLWQVVQDRPDAMRFPDGESFAEAQARVAAALETLSRRHDDSDWVVCVAHSDVIRLAVAHFLGMPLRNFQRIRIAPASLTTLHLQGEKPFFSTINQTFDFCAPHS
jgi:probable phosphoglycerate mutase